MAASRKPSLKPRAGSVPFRDRLCCSIDQAAEAIGRGRRAVYRLIKAGHLETTTLPGIEGQLVRVPSLLRLVGEPLPGEGPP